MFIIEIEKSDLKNLKKMDEQIVQVVHDDLVCPLCGGDVVENYNWCLTCGEFVIPIELTEEEGKHDDI